MLKKILIGLGILVALFIGVVAVQPSDFRVSRTATINAPPEVVFAQINDFHNWEAWSPWAKLDPAVKNTYGGPNAGTGSTFGWVGNKEVGEGAMTILESRPNELIRIKLDFIKPFKSTSTTEFTFKPASDQTTITWSMFGKNNFLSKAFCLFANMDKMVGGDFEKGLAQIKAISEAASKNKPAA